MPISHDAIKAVQRRRLRYGNGDGRGHYTRALMNALEGIDPPTTFTCHDDGTFELAQDGPPPTTPDN